MHSRVIKLISDWYCKNNTPLLLVFLSTNWKQTFLTTCAWLWACLKFFAHMRGDSSSCCMYHSVEINGTVVKIGTLSNHAQALLTKITTVQPFLVLNQLQTWHRLSKYRICDATTNPCICAKKRNFKTMVYIWLAKIDTNFPWKPEEDMQDAALFQLWKLAFIIVIIVCTPATQHNDERKQSDIFTVLIVFYQTWARCFSMTASIINK